MPGLIMFLYDGKTKSSKKVGYVPPCTILSRVDQLPSGWKKAAPGSAVLIRSQQA